MLRLRILRICAFVGSILVVSLASPLLTEAQTWPNGYSNRSTITINHTKVPNTNQTNFPVLISGTYPSLATTGNGGNVTNANGYDIIFTSDAAGSNTLAFERESYSSSTGQINCWVKVPTLSSTSDTVIFMFYGNSSVTTDQSNKTGTWDSNYARVYHMSDNASNTAIADSASNASNATNVANTSSKDVSGQIGGALSYNGTSDGSQTSATVDLTGTHLITLEYWLKFNAYSNTDQLLTESTTNFNNSTGALVIDPDSSGGTCGSGHFDFGVRASGGYVFTDITRPSAGAWHHIVLVISMQNATGNQAYVDGVAQSVTVCSNSTNSLNFGNYKFYLMSRATTSLFAAGTLDEVRISKIQRSADWVATEYNNQSSPSTFYTVGLATAGGSTSPVITSTSIQYDAGVTVTVNGAGLGSIQGSSTLAFNGTTIVPEGWSDTSIVAPLPIGMSGNITAVATVGGVTSNSFTFSMPAVGPLPSGWSDLDMNTGVTGSAGFGAGVFTIKGSGAYISNSADGFHYAYQSLSGDGSIVGRLVSVTGTTYPQYGVMIRETLNAGSTNAFLGYCTYQANTICFQNRSTSGGNTSSQLLSPAVSVPYWVKLTRAGNTFTAYAAQDGMNWTQVGTAQTISMATNVYIGLAVSGNSNMYLATATFDNVSISSAASPAPVITSVSTTTGAVGSQVVISGSNFGASEGSSFVTLNGTPVIINSWSNTAITVTIPLEATSGPLIVVIGPSMNESNYVVFTVESNPLPAGWFDADVNAGVPGSATYANGSITIKASGSSISNAADGMHYAYQSLSGDGSIVARLVNVTGTTYPQLGVMIRETLAPGSTNAFVGYCTYQAYTICFQDRPSTGGNTSWQLLSSNVNVPYWVKLTRVGSTFTAYAAPDGVNWTQVGTALTISMNTNVYIGLASSSNVNTVLNTATFDSVSVTFGTPIPNPIVTSVSPTLGPVGTSVTISGSYFGSAEGTSIVRFNGTPVSSITSWSGTQIVATVPFGATTGAVTVAVNSSIPSNTTVSFTILQLNSATPPSAEAGGTVTLTGTGFGSSQGSSQVQFNGVTATASSWSDTSVAVVVPTGATTGPITITRSSIASNSVPFTVLNSLAVSSISPTLTTVTSTVTITGTGFGSTQSTSNAHFTSGNGLPATITSWSDTQIVAVVPAETVTGPVNVTVAGKTAQGPILSIDSIAVVTDSLGNQSTYTSNIVGGSWVMTDAQGSGCSSCTSRGKIHNAYDSLANTISTTDELNNTTSYAYDSNNNVTSVTRPAVGGTNPTTTYTYNNFGEVLTATDPLGHVTTNTYDIHGDLLTVTTPAPDGNTAASVTHFAYDSKGQLTQITDPLGRVTTLTYTTAGLIATITDAQNHLTTYGYDSHGNRTSVTDALNNQTTFAYDAGDRLTTITYPGGSTTTLAYDYRGRRTSITDQNGKSTTYTYDDADRLLTVKDAANNVATYAYDTENSLSSITDANSHTTAFSYDAFGRVTQTSFPSNAYETYAYDSVGNLTSKTDRKGQTIQYVHDALYRLTKKTYPDSTEVDYVYDLTGKIQQVNDPTGTYQFAYDNMGRLTGTTTSYSFLTGRNFTTSYTYDAASNRTGFTDPEGGATSYAYDTLNHLQTLTPPSAFSGTGSFGFSYDALSRRTQMTRPNGITTNYTYDNLSRLLSVLHQSGASTIDGAIYTVDVGGNRTSKADQLAGVTSNYTSDPIYQLAGVTQGANTAESYTYDPVGNRLSSLGASPYNYNNSNQLTARPGATYTYDSNGNTTSKTDSTGTTNYTWDFENRLTSVTLPGSGGTVSLAYDPFDRRIKKISALGTSIYIYDGANLVEETTVSGVAVARYSHGENLDEPLAMLRSATTSYYHADGLGSITSLSNATGALAQTYAYDSFGNKTNSSGSLANPFWYTGREFDSETSLYYYRSRYYDPSTGRFTSEDPIGYLGGLNLYSYVGSNPTTWTDPLGLRKRSKEECARILANIVRKTGLLVKEISKYDPVLDGRGGPTWKPGGHYEEIRNLKRGIWNEITTYLSDCRGDDNQPIPPCAFDTVRKYVQPPVLAPKPGVPTQFEIDMLEESARYRYYFWQNILEGDGLLLAAVGATATAPVFHVVRVLIPAFGF